MESYERSWNPLFEIFEALLNTIGIGVADAVTAQSVSRVW
jgi:hypothetical protein